MGWPEVTGGARRVGEAEGVGARRGGGPEGWAPKGGGLNPGKNVAPKSGPFGLEPRPQFHEKTPKRGKKE